MAYYNEKEMRIEMSQDDKDYFKEQNGKLNQNGVIKTPVSDSLINWVKTGKIIIK